MENGYFLMIIVLCRKSDICKVYDRENVQLFAADGMISLKFHMELKSCEIMIANKHNILFNMIYF